MVRQAYPIPVQNIKPLLTVSFTSGDISLMNSYDDLSPTIIQSGLKGAEQPAFNGWASLPGLLSHWPLQSPLQGLTGSVREVFSLAPLLV